MARCTVHQRPFAEPASRNRGDEPEAITMESFGGRAIPEA